MIMRRDRLQAAFLVGAVAATIVFNTVLAQSSDQLVYKAIINDTTSALTPLFTVDVTDALSYGITGEMSTGFSINITSGVVSTAQQLDIGRYEFVITVILQSFDLSLLVGLVDVLSSSDPCDNQLLYGRCSHTCVVDSSNPHGYSCQCNSGYSLQRNGYICRANDPEPSLLISYAAGGLAKLDTFTRTTEIIASGIQIEAFDYHYGNQIIYYVNGNTLYSVDMSGQNTASLYDGLSQVTSIAVNWLNNDIYITTDSGTIERLTIGPTPTRNSLISGRLSPRHIVLDAEDGVMYWIEDNSDIYKAALDGSSIVNIAINVNNTQDLSVDVVEHRVYWSAMSGDVYQILSAAEDGSNTTVVYDSDLFHSASLSVFEDYIYSAKESTQLIYRVDKYTRQTSVNVTLLAGEDVDIIKVYHRLKQPNSVEDTDECALNNGGCSQICNDVIGGLTCECYTGYQLEAGSCNVPATCSTIGCDHSCVLDSSNVASCVCDPGYMLSDNGTTCLDINECIGSHGCSHGCTNNDGSFLCTCPGGLFLSDDGRNCNGCAVNNGGCDQICMQDSLGYSCSCLDGYTLGSDGKRCHYTEIPELLLSNSRLAISTVNGRVYVIEIDGTELERNVDNDNDHGNLEVETGLIYAMEYNLETGKVYFSDRNTSTLWMASLDNEIRASDDRQLVTTESVHGWALAYDWISHCLYWSDDRGNRIGKLNELSGTVEYVATTTGSPRGIAVDPFKRKLFWSESSGIKSFNLDDNVTTTVYTSINGPAGLTIDILQERIFFVDNLLPSHSNVYSTDYDGQDVTLLVENHTNLIPFQIAHADDFVYWTGNSRLIQRIQIGGASSAVSSVPVSLQTESGSDSTFYSLVAVSTLHRPPAGVCYPNPCLNEGLCSDDGQGIYTCFCRDNYFGENCTMQNHCMVNPCQNGGSCNLSSENASGFSCQCPDGYFGDMCEQQDFCRNIECEHGGTCQNENDGFVCSCTDGYTGETCNVDIDDCEDEPCQNGGTCVDQVNGFICNCVDGYTGETCDVDIDDCEDESCQNGGTCIDQVNGFICNCVDGYTGETCDVDIDDCEDEPCQNGGTCIDQVNGFICNCADGYTEETCDVDIDDCEDESCQNGGICVDQVNGFICNCTDGYTGETCDVDIDDCEDEPCQNGGTCIDQVNGFICNCVDGYTGETCDVDIDDCENEPCQNGGICVDQVNGFICNCTDGYTGDICQTPICTEPCQNGGTCIAPDQCQCTEFLGGPTCTIPVCPENFCPDGQACNPSFTGATCTEIDDCESGPCQNGGTCVDQVNGFTCNCVDGYTGETCDVDIDDCENGPCQNGGTCIDQVNGFICNCTVGYTGETCDVNIDDCEDEPCQNGGTCVDQVNSFYCDCADGYTGDICQTPICTEPCQNGGTCIAPDQCQCTEFLGGPTCTIPVCPENFCANGGTCNPSFTGATCSCPPSHVGTRCETRNPRFGRVEGNEDQDEGLTGGETAGVSVGTILGVALIVIVVIVLLFFSYRYWIRRRTYKTDSNVVYGNPVYYEASDTRGKDVLGKERALENPVYGIYSKPAGDDIHININSDSNNTSDDNTSVDNSSNDVLMENVYVNKNKDLPQEDGLNSNDIV